MLRSLTTVSGLTLLSRILGLLRDMVVGYYLGSGARADAWIAAFQFPNLFRRVLGEGAFNAAFVPMYSAKLEESEEKAFGFGGNVIAILALILAGIFAISFLFIGQIMWLINSGFPPEKLELTTSLARITTGYLFFVCLLASFSGILNSHKKFFAAAFSYTFLNIAFLTGLLIFTRFVNHPEYILAWSLLAAGIIQFLVVAIPVYKMGLRVKIQMPKLDGDMKKLGLLMVPGLMSAGIQQLNLLVGSWVGSFQDGAKTVLYYSDRINQLPLGMIGIAFGIVLLPEISRKLKSGKLLEAKESMQTGMTHAMFLTIPAMVGMMVLAEPMMFAIFKGGAMNHAAIVDMSHALIAFAVGCPAYVMSRVLQPGYFARQDTKTPMMFTFVSAAVNVVLCLVAWFTMKDSGTLHIGCAAATSIAGWVNVALLAIGLRKHDLICLSSQFWLRLTKMLVVSIFMGLVLWVGADLLESPLHSDSRLFRISTLVSVIGTGVVIYFVGAHFTKTMTLRDLKAGFRR